MDNVMVCVKCGVRVATFVRDPSVASSVAEPVRPLVDDAVWVTLIRNVVSVLVPLLVARIDHVRVNHRECVFTDCVTERVRVTVHPAVEVRVNEAAESWSDDVSDELVVLCCVRED